MPRARFASLTLAAAAALAVSGCMTSSSSCDNGGGFFSRFNLFHRNTASPDCGCCMDGGEFMASSLPVPVAPEGPVLTVPPQTSAPSAPPPRIITVPQQQAPNVPYAPTGLKR